VARRDFAIAPPTRTLTMVLGYAWFMKTKKAFADVM
jgi:hypothetical protein